MTRRVSVDSRQQGLLVQIVRASEKGGGVFLTVSTFDGSTMLHDGLDGRTAEIDMGDIYALAADGLLTITERRPRGDLSFIPSGAGRQRAHEIESALDDSGPRGEPKLEMRLDELKVAVVDATSLDDYQDIGRRCREILIDIARNLFEPAMVPSGEPQPGHSDAKAMLGHFFGSSFPGSTQVDKHARALTDAAFDLANSVTHSSKTTKAHAFAAAQATLLLVRLAQGSKPRWP